MSDLRWKLIDTYERPAYAGFTDIVLLGWDNGDPDRRVMFFGIGWKDEANGVWIDNADRKPWQANPPSHWLCSLRGTFQQDNRD